MKYLGPALALLGLVALTWFLVHRDGEPIPQVAVHEAKAKEERSAAETARKEFNATDKAMEARGKRVVELATITLATLPADPAGDVVLPAARVVDLRDLAILAVSQEADREKLAEEARAMALHYDKALDELEEANRELKKEAARPRLTWGRAAILIGAGALAVLIL